MKQPFVAASVTCGAAARAVKRTSTPPLKIALRLAEHEVAGYVSLRWDIEAVIGFALKRVVRQLRHVCGVITVPSLRLHRALSRWIV